MMKITQKGIKEIMYPGQNKYKRFKMNSKKEINITDVIKKVLLPKGVLFINLIKDEKVIKSFRMFSH